MHVKIVYYLFINVKLLLILIMLLKLFSIIKKFSAKKATE